MDNKRYDRYNGNEVKNYFNPNYINLLNVKFLDISRQIDDKIEIHNHSQFYGGCAQPLQPLQPSLIGRQATAFSDKVEDYLEQRARIAAELEDEDGEIESNKTFC